jgi:hypothetical protein
MSKLLASLILFGRDAGLSERLELAPEAELVPVLWCLRKSGVPEVSPASAGTLPQPRQIGEVVDNSQLIDTEPLIRNYAFGTGTLVLPVGRLARAERGRWVGSEWRQEGTANNHINQVYLMDNADTKSELQVLLNEPQVVREH